MDRRAPLQIAPQKFFVFRPLSVPHCSASCPKRQPPRAQSCHAA